MLANALYFEDARKTVNRLKDLRVFLDTRPLLRALGAAEPAVCEAEREMLALLREFKVKMFVFPHTIQEMSGVLDGIAGALRRGRSGYKAQGTVAGYNREAIDAFVRQGVTAAEVESINAELEERLVSLGVHRLETPPHVEKSQDRRGSVREVASGRRAIRIPRDAPERTCARSPRSIVCVEGRDRGELGQARALFVTTNGKLVRAAREFFRAEGRDARVGHAMLDVALTAQLWVRSSNRKPDTPRRMLIADCYAALAPSPELWARWVAAIARLR